MVNMASFDQGPGRWIWNPGLCASALCGELVIGKITFLMGKSTINGPLSIADVPNSHWLVDEQRGVWRFTPLTLILWWCYGILIGIQWNFTICIYIILSSWTLWLKVVMGNHGKTIEHDDITEGSQLGKAWKAKDLTKNITKIDDLGVPGYLYFTMCPPSCKLVYNPFNYSYKDHKQ